MSPPLDLARVWILSPGGRPELLMEPGKHRKRGDVGQAAWWAIEGWPAWVAIEHLWEALGGDAPGAIRLRRPAEGAAGDGRRAG